MYDGIRRSDGEYMQALSVIFDIELKRVGPRNKNITDVSVYTRTLSMATSNTESEAEAQKRS